MPLTQTPTGLTERAEREAQLLSSKQVSTHQQVQVGQGAVALSDQASNQTADRPEAVAQIAQAPL